MTQISPIPEGLSESIVAIQLNRVVKTFHTTAGEYKALKGINVTFREHEFVSVIGKSGSGKSTLLNMITGIDHPTSGEVIIGNTNIYKMNESQRSLWRGRNLGIVFQFFQLMPMLTLLENTMLPMDYCNVFPIQDRPKRAMELLSMVNLQDQAHKLPSAVSSGQQQSAAIARALANDPPIVVADEPTGNLDSRSADMIIQLFDQLVHQGKTIVMVTHDPSMTEKTSRTVIIADGEIIDEAIARALPLLSHHQMIEATHLVERVIIPPNSSVITKGQTQNYFYMIVNGKVEVVLENRQKKEYVVAQLGRGQFFGEVELLCGGNSIASIRTTNDQPVELSVLNREPFLKILADSPLTEDAIARVVQSRLDENRISDRRQK
jgi:putative ABC transport system ATP-binding protein